MWILKESENSRPGRKRYSFPVHCYVYFCCVCELNFLLFLYSPCPEESRSSIAASIIMYTELCAGFSDCNSCVHTSFQCVWCGTGGCSYQRCRENSLNNAAAVGREGTVWTIINTEWKMYTFRTHLLQYSFSKLFSSIGNICTLLHCGVFVWPLLHWKCNNAICIYHWARCHCQQYTNTGCCTKMLLWGIYVSGNNRMYLGLHVKFPTFLSHFNEIWSFWTDILKSPP